MIRKQRGVGSTIPVGILMLAVLLSACGGGHSSPAEPEGDRLTVLSSSPPEGTVFSRASLFQVHVVLQYHLANGPGGELETHLLRADGSPLIQLPFHIQFPSFDYPIPLIRADGPFTIDDKFPIPADAGSAVLLRCLLYPKAGAQPTATLTLQYALSP
jgi:hypothetical protein